MINLSDETYDKLKKALTVLFPATSALYSALAAILGWPGAVEVTAVVAAIATYLGVVLNISSRNHWNEVE